MLRNFFSSWGKNPWKEFANTIGAVYEDGGFSQSERIVFQQNDHCIVISIGTNQRGNKGFRYTRFRCSYTASSPCYFKIKPKSSGLFSRKKSNTISIQHFYQVSSTNEVLFARLMEDDTFSKHLKVLKNFHYTSEKDDGEWGPTFLPSEHQLCLELEDEIEDPLLLTSGIGIILATINIYNENGLLNPEKTTVKYY